MFSVPLFGLEKFCTFLYQAMWGMTLNCTTQRFSIWDDKGIEPYHLFHWFALGMFCAFPYQGQCRWTWNYKIKMCFQGYSTWDPCSLFHVWLRNVLHLSVYVSNVGNDLKLYNPKIFHLRWEGHWAIPPAPLVCLRNVLRFSLPRTVQRDLKL